MDRGWLRCARTCESAFTSSENQLLFLPSRWTVWGAAGNGPIGLGLGYVPPGTWPRRRLTRDRFTERLWRASCSEADVRRAHPRCRTLACCQSHRFRTSADDCGAKTTRSRIRGHAGPQSKTFKGLGRGQNIQQFSDLTILRLDPPVRYV